MSVLDLPLRCVRLFPSGLSAIRTGSGSPAITAGTEAVTSGSREPMLLRHARTRAGFLATGPAARAAGTGSTATGDKATRAEGASSSCSPFAFAHARGFDLPRKAGENKDVLPESGPVAQLGARFHGMEEVIGSIPIRSTNNPV